MELIETMFKINSYIVNDYKHLNKLIFKKDYFKSNNKSNKIRQ